MAEIYPFRALHYNSRKIPQLATVVTQPYDKITPEMQARYYDLSPYNLVRIIRGVGSPGDNPQENAYTRAARSFQNWVQDDILTSESEPAFYPYFQEYKVPGGEQRRKLRRGFIALCRLEDYSAGVVHRHEETLSGPKADRLELLKSVRAHFGQIFMLYSDPAGAIERQLEASASGKPWQDLQDEYGTRHRVWRLADPLAIERVVAAMREKKLVIADGHHRYETALEYRNLRRRQPLPDDRPEYVMVTLVRIETDGLTILPTHRVVHSLGHFDWGELAARAERFFHWEELPAGARGAQDDQSRFAGSAAPVDTSHFLESLAEPGREQPALGAYGGKGKLALLRLRRDLDLEKALPDVPASLRRLDVIVLHRLVLEAVLGIDRQAVKEEKNLRYVRDLEVATREVDAGKAQVSFLMNPTPIDAVWSNALAGRFLPQKSTDFYPKLLSGLAMYWLDNPRGM